MNKFLNDLCESAESFYLKKQSDKFEIEDHLNDGADCQDISGENLRLKKLLKRAVEGDFAPQSLTDSIKREIRR